MAAQLAWYVGFMLLSALAMKYTLPIAMRLADPDVSTGRAFLLSLGLVPVSALPLVMIWMLTGVWDTGIMLVVLGSVVAAQLAAGLLGMYIGDPDGTWRSVSCWTGFAVQKRHVKLVEAIGLVVVLGSLVFMAFITWTYFATDYKSPESTRELARLVFGYQVVVGGGAAALSSSMLLTYDEIEAKHRDRLLVSAAASLVPIGVWLSLFVYSFNPADRSIGLETSPQVIVILVGLFAVAVVLPYFMGNRLARLLTSHTHDCGARFANTMSTIAASARRENPELDSIRSWEQQVGREITNAVSKPDIMIAARILYPQFDAAVSGPGTSIEDELAEQPLKGGDHARTALLEHPDKIERVGHLTNLFWMGGEAREIAELLETPQADDSDVERGLKGRATHLEHRSSELRAEAARELSRKPLAAGVIMSLATLFWGSYMGGVNALLQESVNDVLSGVGIPIEQVADGSGQSGDSGQSDGTDGSESAGGPEVSEETEPTSVPPEESRPEPPVTEEVAEPPPAAATQSATTTTEAPVIVVPPPLADWPVRSILLNDHRVLVAIADTDERRMQGLTGVGDLVDLDGILYVYDEAAPNIAHVNADGMFAIDIIWFDAAGDSVVKASAVPGCAPETCDSHWSENPTQFVVETPVGTFGDEWPITLRVAD